MKLSELKPGVEVAVNTRPDGMVYTLESLEGFQAHLTYPSLRGPIKTCIDISCLHRPTKAQLENAKKVKHG